MKPSSGLLVLTLLAGGSLWAAGPAVIAKKDDIFVMKWGDSLVRGEEVRCTFGPAEKKDACMKALKIFNDLKITVKIDWDALKSGLKNCEKDPGNSDGCEIMNGSESKQVRFTKESTDDHRNAWKVAADGKVGSSGTPSSVTAYLDNDMDENGHPATMQAPGPSSSLTPGIERAGAASQETAEALAE